MNDDFDLDLLTTEVEIQQSTHDNPSIARVVLALLAAGVLLAVVISVIAGAISTISPKKVDAICGSAASCDDLSLADVRSLTGLTLPDSTVIVSSSYAKTDDAITVTAALNLPSGSDSPFDETGYSSIATPSVEWPIDGLQVLDYYAATGEQGTLNAEAVYAVDDYLTEVVLVTVVRDRT